MHTHTIYKKSFKNIIKIREILKLISISQYVSITPITGITDEVNIRCYQKTFR